MGSGLKKHRYICMLHPCTFTLLWALSVDHCEKQPSRLNDDLISFSVTFFCLSKQRLESNIFSFWRLTFGHPSELDFPPRKVWFHQQPSKFTNRSPLDFSQLLLVMLWRRKPQKISNHSQSNLLRNLFVTQHWHQDDIVCILLDIITLHCGRKWWKYN